MILLTPTPNIRGSKPDPSQLYRVLSVGGVAKTLSLPTVDSDISPMLLSVEVELVPRAGGHRTKLQNADAAPERSSAGQRSVCPGLGGFWRFVFRIGRLRAWSLGLWDSHLGFSGCA